MSVNTTLVEKMAFVPKRATQIILDAFEPYILQRRDVQSDGKHLIETISWLCRAQDAVNGRGVSIRYSKDGGWCPDAYPETTGYILATFLKYAEFSGDLSFIDRAIILGSWESEIQRGDGAVLSSIRKNDVRVFNTGQVILGWCCLFEKTHDEKYLQSAIKAAQFLLSIQETDGSWIRDTHCGARTYHARVAWSLMRLADICGKQEFFDAGYRNIRWVLSRQNKNGWFRDCGFFSQPPITHVIAYTMRGLLECHHMMNKRGVSRTSEILDAAVQPGKLIKNIINKYRICNVFGLLPAAFDENWQPAAKYSCLTGNAQIAVCLMRLGQMTGDKEYFETAASLIDALKPMQDIHSHNLGVKGALAGSFPFYGGYERGAFPNWAAKFMADALMMKIKSKESWWVQA